MAILQKDLYKKIQTFDLYSILTPLKIRLHFIDLILQIPNILLKLVNYMLTDRSMLRFAPFIVRTLSAPPIISALWPVFISASLHCVIIDTKEIRIHILSSKLLLFLLSNLTNESVKVTLVKYFIILVDG